MNVDILNFSGTENHNFSNIHSFGNGVSDSVEENLRRDFLIHQGILLWIPVRRSRLLFAIILRFSFCAISTVFPIVSISLVSVL